MSEFFLLPASDPDTLARLDSSVVCKAIDPRDFPNWEAVLLDPERDPRPHMRAQRQQRNDCQGQSLCNGTEKRDWYVTGTMRQRSDYYAYNASEFLDQKRVGADRGTSIGAGVDLLVNGISSIGVDPGLPLESDWDYRTYERNTNRFKQRAKAVDIEESCLTEHQPAPDFESTLVGMAAGGSCHIGTRWGVRWKSLGGKREMSAVPRGGGGHATEPIWAVKINRNWYIVAWNSHGDEYYLIGEKVWNQLVDMRFQPFGGYLLMPDKAEERFLTAMEIQRGTFV